MQAASNVSGAGPCIQSCSCSENGLLCIEACHLAEVALVWPLEFGQLQQHNAHCICNPSPASYQEGSYQAASCSLTAALGCQVPLLLCRNVGTH